MFENLPIQTSWYSRDPNQKFAGVLCSEESDDLVLMLNPVEGGAPGLDFPIIGEAANGTTISITDGHKPLELNARQTAEPT